MGLTLHYARLEFEPAQPVYELHRDLSRALGKRDGAGVLFRTDVKREGAAARRVVLVQSRQPGRWKELAESQQASARLVRWEANAREWGLSAGERFRFFLRANATRAKKATLRELAGVRGEPFRQARGKRVAIRGEAELGAWLRRQGERCGFEIAHTDFPVESGGHEEVPAVRIAVSPGRDVKWRNAGRHGDHAGTDFEGLLVVTKPDDLLHALAEGIGPGKAFGFGLLSLKRAPPEEP